MRAEEPDLAAEAAAVTAPAPDLPLGPPQGGLGRRAIRGTAWAAAGAYSSFAISLLLNFALARLLAPATFGAYAIAGATCDVVFLLAGLSFGQAIVQLHGQAEKLRGTVLLLSLGLAYVLTLVAFAAFPLLRAGFGEEGARAFLPIAMARSLAIVVAAQTAGFEGDFRYRTLSIVRFASLLVTSGAVLAVATRTHGIEALVTREAVPPLLTLLLVLPGTLRWLRSEGLWSGPTARRVLRIGSGWLLTRGAETLLYRVDQLLLAPVVSQADLGFYYQSRYIVQLPNTFLAPATMQVALRTYSALGERREEQSKVHGLARYFLLRLLVPVVVLLAAFPAEVLRVAFGTRWLAAAPLLATLSPLVLLVPIIESAKTLLLARHRYRSVALVLGLQVVVMATLVLVLRGSMGAGAAAIGTLAAAVVGAVLAEWLASDPSTRKASAWARPVLVGAVVLALCFAARRALPIHGGAAELALALGASVLAFVLLLVLDGATLRENVQLIWAKGFRR